MLAAYIEACYRELRWRKDVVIITGRRSTPNGEVFYVRVVNNKNPEQDWRVTSGTDLISLWSHTLTSILAIEPDGSSMPIVK